MNLDFYEGKRVLVTGHTGFKGTWLCRILVNAGAVVAGYALAPSEDSSLYERSGLSTRMKSVCGDIRDYEKLVSLFDEFQPEIVFHLAAQPIVRESYKEPRYTYETNVMGTVNVMECVRTHPSVRSVLNVTTDKVYWNREWAWGYRETDPLDGFDPYSNSKSCSELVTHCYKNSFLAEQNTAVSTARAGNVIGGGDFANDRIIPDCVRAASKGEVILLRNPWSTRPYQHVLEPLSAYLLIAERQYGDPQLSDYYNVGPEDCDCVTTGELADLFCKYWGENVSWETRAQSSAPHEAGFLKLDCSKIRQKLGWRPGWHVEECIRQTCRFYRLWVRGEDITWEMDREIAEYFGSREYNG